VATSEGQTSMTAQFDDGRGRERRFLITGALGAIGVWTIRSLLAHGCDVVALDLGGTGHRLALALDDDQQTRVTHVQGNITDLAAVERVLDEYAITNVIHLAALQVPLVRENPVLGAHVNVVGTANVLEAVRRRADRIGPLVYASSIAVYGPGGTLASDDVPGTLYGVYKRANEGAAQRYFQDYGVSSLGLRPHTVFGPGRDQGVTSAPTTAMVAAAARQSFHIPFGGRIQLQHTADAGEAFARAGLLDYEGACVHNLDGAVMAVDDVASLIERAAPGTTITVGEAALPLIEAVDGSSFVDLLGGSVMGPAEARIAESVRHFEELLDRGLVRAPVPASSGAGR
jgi:UDP-glucuronate 4-epimerase